MAERYDPVATEQKWQQRWAESGIYKFHPIPQAPKHYALTMLPYPSGNLHIGHWYAMSPSDTRARYMRMRGYDVFFPMGFDAFGLPAENAAIKRNIHPRQWTYANIERMRQQLKAMGMMIDWDQEVITCDPEYYRWNQWFFIQFFKRGLAYRTYAPVDWCPSCNTTLAREQVVGEERRCERCGTPVIKKDLDQWLFRITAYAEELLDFSKIEWPERIITMQRNWIGRSEGASVIFTTESGDPIEVFTTRPDTLWGATFLVLAPEHPLVDKVTSDAQRAVVEAYKQQAARESEIERLSTEKEKTGVWTGGYAINPATNQRVPIWIADYVLMSYGTGAIMGVPGHDQRDFEFARAYNLPIVVVVQPEGQTLDPATMSEAWPGEGTMVNSGPLNGLPAGKGEGQSVKAAIRWLEQQGKGRAAVTYRLRDWLISRQRYWGTPIPIIYCPQCGTLPVPEEQLPVTLPDDVDFVPTGQSPLKLHPTWRFTTCPQCGGQAERDTDTMDTFVDSSWYQYRYLSPHYTEGPFDPAIGQHWLPVDQYTGGAEHAVMHLLYTRFWTKVMRDLGLVDFDEPMVRLFNQGIILGEDNEKMSKSRGNVVDPDDLVARYGADAVRTFLMFIGPWDQGGPWNSRGMEGTVRFVNRCWNIVTEQPRPSSTPGDAEALRRITHRTIKKVGDDLERFAFNTAIAALMEFVNELYRARETTLYGSDAWHAAIRTLVLLLAPFTPHLAEELWERIGEPYSVHQQPWPQYDETLLAEQQVELAVQINGKLRDRITVAADASEEYIRQLALSSDKVQAALNGKTVAKTVVVPGKLVNIVVR
ncbi:leucine--tRNA ligase [Kallotenue papyrolyticum]|uniref:leucine--tRNA ligase n=1 Tax=Kallotenue papyrolyticum TaxID=1325125 RepID=UPI00049290B3|nr:leucine--tRNA ligase [Kallotenue papyrolyticum]